MTLTAGEITQLASDVWRIVAPNAGLMTGPGTNSYLVGSPAGICVIDPGPESAIHTERLLALTPGPITTIALTHTHRDHAPGALALLAATGASLIALPPPNTPENDTRVEPAAPAADVLACSDFADRLTLIPTPGHASNHLCFWHAAHGMLFTGDHVMNGSTVVIAPPDGDMLAYFESLASVAAMPLQTIAPGHGELITDPTTVVTQLIAHRRRREAKVRDALREVGPESLAGLVSHVYDDVDVRLHGLAKKSLLAHLIGLQQSGLARIEGDMWRISTGRTKSHE